MWDIRGPNQVFYYRYRKVNGQARRVYVGTGLTAALAAAEDARRRDARQQARDDLRNERLRHGEAAGPLRQLTELVDGLSRAALLASGFHQHDRGAWRPWRAAAGVGGGQGE